MQRDIHLFYWLHRLFDAVIPVLTGITIALSTDAVVNSNQLLLFILSGLIFTITAQFSGLYRLWRGRELSHTGKTIFRAWFVTLALISLIHFASPLSLPTSQWTLVTFAVIPPVLFFSYRYVIQQILAWSRQRGRLQTRVAIVGAGKTGQELAEKLQQSPFLGYQIQGFFDDNPLLSGQKVNGFEVISTLDNLNEKLLHRGCTEVYICLPLSAQERIRYLLETLSDSSLTVKYVPSLFSFDLLHTQWHDLQGTPVLSVYTTPMSSLSNRIVKRLEDLILAASLLTVSLPFMLLIALGIKATSSGPVLFKQTRYGLNGKAIEVYKFRTMHCMENTSVIQAKPGDPRVTPFGQFLRKSSLDELPQFVNVLLGNMSVVGPRPHAVAHNEEFRKLVPKYMQRHSVKPGITGLAQINGYRGQTDTLEKIQKRVEFDLHYINTWSLWLDIKIFLLTVFKALNDKNAY